MTVGINKPAPKGGTNAMKILWIALSLAVVLVGEVITMEVAAQAGGQQQTNLSKNGEVQFLFVMNSKSGSFKDNTLTLKGIPIVTYFSDRPDRIAGDVSLSEFVDSWARGPDSFKVDPPNAALSFSGRTLVQTIIVEISNPTVKNNSISFKARSLKGDIPEEFGPSSLFIDVNAPLFIHSNN